MSNYDIDIEELRDAVRLMSSGVQKNTSIITPDELGSDFFYHISFGKFSEFVPNISRRAAMTEDNTVPRVHVADTLNNAWNGYASGPYMMANTKPSLNKAKGLKADYKGGFYIHRIPFRACLKPNKKMVYDADFTNEHWLVTYNEMTRVFPATCIGRVVGEFVTFIPRTDKMPIELCTLVLEVDSPDGLKLAKGIHLKKGFYRYKTSTQDGVQDIEEISKSEFLSVKTTSAAMLSESEVEVPRFLF